MANAFEQSTPRSHTVTLDNRERILITGVEDVPQFNEQQVVMETVAGELTVFGSGLHIARLNLEDGQVSLDGMILGMDYSDRSAGKRSLLGKLFG